jgi:hypothetical protein
VHTVVKHVLMCPTNLLQITSIKKFPKKITTELSVQIIHEKTFAVFFLWFPWHTANLVMRKSDHFHESIRSLWQYHCTTDRRGYPVPSLSGASWTLFDKFWTSRKIHIPTTWYFIHIIFNAIVRKQNMDSTRNFITCLSPDQFSRLVHIFFLSQSSIKTIPQFILMNLTVR